MANLNDFALIDKKVKATQDRYGYDSTGEAFDHFAVQLFLGLNDEEIEEAITDDSGDEGIDALYMRDGVLYVFSCKYANTIENANKNFPESALDKVNLTIQRIMNKTLLKHSVNEALWDQVKIVWEALAGGPIKIQFHFFSNKEQPLDHAKMKFEQDVAQYREVQVIYWDSRKIADWIIGQRHKKMSGKVQMLDKQYFERIDGNVKGIVGPIPASELIKLVSIPGEIGRLDEDAFNENIRVYYKLDNKINREIYDTALSEENFKFYYLNNGITIMCEEYDFTPSRSPTINLTNFQIVNGGQTTHALAEAYLKNPEKIGEEIIVLARIYASKDKAISEKIGEKTNRQTPISSRDLLANDEIQRKLEEEFLALGYYYERKKSQFDDKTDLPVLDSELLGQLYMSYYLGQPSEARNQKSLVFTEFYDKIFNSNVTASKMLVPYRISLPLEEIKREIQRKKRKREQIDEAEAFVSRAVFHIIYVMHQLAERNGVNVFDIEAVSRLQGDAVDILRDVTRDAKIARGEAYTHDKFFKERSTISIIDRSLN